MSRHAAFQASLPLRLSAHPARQSPARRRNRVAAAPSRAPRRVAGPRPPRCAASAAGVLKDEVIRVPSAVPADRHHPVKVSLRAESLGRRRRRVVGGVDIAATPARVWRVLTSYDRIERYMPNIVSSTVEARDGVVYLDQVGIISNKLGLRSRMLVQVHEREEDRFISFSRVEGRDFSEFVGSYSVSEVEGGVRLDYELVAMPFPLFPMYLVERKVFKEIPRMLASIREEAILGRVIPFENE